MIAAPVLGAHDHHDSLTYCIICTNFVPLENVTAGSLYASGSQAFACSNHLANRALWITVWALFDAKEAMVLGAHINPTEQSI